MVVKSRRNNLLFWQVYFASNLLCPLISYFLRFEKLRNYCRSNIYKVDFQESNLVPCKRSQKVAVQWLYCNWPGIQLCTHEHNIQVQRSTKMIIHNHRELTKQIGINSVLLESQIRIYYFRIMKGFIMWIKSTGWFYCKNKQSALQNITEMNIMHR